MDRNVGYLNEELHLYVMKAYGEHEGRHPLILEILQPQKLRHILNTMLGGSQNTAVAGLNLHRAAGSYCTGPVSNAATSQQTALFVQTRGSDGRSVRLLAHL